MTLLTANNLTVHFGQYTVFSGLSLTVHKGDRIAIVGSNGQGKTTLLRLLAGDLSPSDGQVSIAKQVQLGYIQQDATLTPFEGTLYQFMETVFVELQQQQKELTRFCLLYTSPSPRDPE